MLAIHNLSKLKSLANNAKIKSSLKFLLNTGMLFQNFQSKISAYLITIQCEFYEYQYLLSISEGPHHRPKDHAGAEPSHEEDLNLVGGHAVAVVEGVDMGALEPVPRC